MKNKSTEIAKPSIFQTDDLRRKDQDWLEIFRGKERLKNLHEKREKERGRVKERQKKRECESEREGERVIE